jgi:hypothetical protein
MRKMQIEVHGGKKLKILTNQNFFSIFVFRGNTQGVSLYGGFTVIKI